MKQISDKQFEQYQSIRKAAGLPIKGCIDKWIPLKQPYFFNQEGYLYKYGLREKHNLTNTGNERSIQELCKIASDRTIRGNIISAWLDSEGSGKLKYKQGKDLYSIYYRDNKWRYIKVTFYCLEEIYMIEEDAIKLCEDINNGEVELLND